MPIVFIPSAVHKLQWTLHYFMGRLDFFVFLRGPESSWGTIILHEIRFRVLNSSNTVSRGGQSTSLMRQ